MCSCYGGCKFLQPSSAVQMCLYCSSELMGVWASCGKVMGLWGMVGNVGGVKENDVCETGGRSHYM